MLEKTNHDKNWCFIECRCCLILWHNKHLPKQFKHGWSYNKCEKMVVYIYIYMSSICCYKNDKMPFFAPFGGCNHSQMSQKAHRMTKK